ncbi:nudix hydrolase 18, mitochondrial-like [Andrographis paniculata]|uniref:nudix hydrolase 18, mitochondrial-like n=1 Tax=Andrographis paniculata TaxID=175694 RepID=UPI0021E77B93|nr:nudix hydrolase 18, mitochondrial-like [Andrographis paniculata]
MTLHIKKLATSPSRSGRHLQRYNQGFRQVVGCVPYRIKAEKSAEIDEISIEDLEVLLISSQKSSRMMFPKGGWELDEDIGLAASRETLEEAGVVGLLGDKLGEWIFKSRSQEKQHEASMFSLLVKEELEVWPEKDVRHRVWMTIDEARELCSHLWMKEALEAFVRQFANGQTIKEESLASCGFDELRLSIGEPSSDEEDCYLVR